MPALDVPFGFDGRGRTATAEQEDHVRDMIQLVLFTAPGERVNRPDFGCGVRQMVFAPLSDALTATTQHLVQGALLRWLGDLVHIESVEVRTDESELHIAIRYLLKETGLRGAATFAEPLP